MLLLNKPSAFSLPDGHVQRLIMKVFHNANDLVPAHRELRNPESGKDQPR